MITLLAFILLTIFLIMKLNNVMGMKVGFIVEKESIPDFEKKIVEEILTVDSKIALVKAHYKNFQLDDFLAKAQKAFEIIFKAYSSGDKVTLKELLSQRTFAAFSLAIEDRDKRGESLSGSIEGFSSTEFIDAEISNEVIYVTVRFVTAQTNVLRDASGMILEGSPDFVENRTDVWVFSHAIRANDNRWLLHEIKSED